MRSLILLTLLTAVCLPGWTQHVADHALVNGFPVDSHGRPFFPLGSYELPKDDTVLREMVHAGFNLFRCHNRADLERVAAAGAMGWVALPMQLGDDARIRRQVEALKDQPGLAVWEGPDEIVWHFAPYGGLYRRGVYSFKPGEAWWEKNPHALDDAEPKAEAVLSKLGDGIRAVRGLDRTHRPIWINETAYSDMKFIRDYIDQVNITGCDIYPIHGDVHKPVIVADYTDRFRSVGRGRPVWMVLQGFAWKKLLPRNPESEVYPSFAETRWMAYGAITHGAKGILYWGMDVAPPTPAFRESLYALASELAPLTSFLMAPEHSEVRVVLTEAEGRPEVGERGVSWVCRNVGNDWIVVVINEDSRPHLGVEVQGLSALNGRTMQLLYGSETAKIKDGGFVTRLLPMEVKVFATSRRWESASRSGRDYESVQ